MKTRIRWINNLNRMTQAKHWNTNFGIFAAPDIQDIANGWKYYFSSSITPCTLYLQLVLIFRHLQNLFRSPRTAITSDDQLRMNMIDGSSWLSFMFSPVNQRFLILVEWAISLGALNSLNNHFITYENYSTWQIALQREINYVHCYVWSEPQKGDKWSPITNATLSF